MRLVLLTMCGAALVACTDANNPTAPTSKKTAPSLPSDRQPGLTGSGYDLRPVSVRIEELVTRRFGKVTLPPDPFSNSADAVHPDIACPAVWIGPRCWLLYTPYKNSDPSYENPAFLAASDDTAWTTPPAVRNPIVGYPGSGYYNSDPDHDFDPWTGRMIQIYRLVTDSANKIMIMSTGTAKEWKAPVLAFAERRHDAVSPALVIEPDRTGKIWYVRSGPLGCGARSSRVELRVARPDVATAFEDATWSSPTPVDMSIPGYVIWHLDVTRLPRGGYVALIAAFPGGTSCSNSDLWLATSDDGLVWRNFAIPIFWRGMRVARARSISTWYRGTLRYDVAADSLHLWPSALSDRTWSVYHVAVPMTLTLSLLGSAESIDMRSLAKVRPRAMPAMPMP